MATTHLTALTLVLSLAFASFATAQSAERADAEREARQLRWIGASFMLTGGVVETLSYTAWANKQTWCSGNSFLVTCSEVKRTNWGVMIAGLGTSVSGIMFWMAGDRMAKRAKLLPSIAVGPSRWSVQQRVAW
jgi:hypothetical protein